MAKENISEERTATASYILTFYQNVQLLTHYGANYYNLLLVLKEKYNVEVPAEEKNNLLQYCNNLRYYVYVSYMQAKTINKRIGNEINKELENKVNEVLKQLVVETQDINAIIEELHELLSIEIMKDLLTSSQQIISGVFSLEATE